MNTNNLEYLVKYSPLTESQMFDQIDAEYGKPYHRINQDYINILKALYNLRFSTAFSVDIFIVDMDDAEAYARKVCDQLTVNELISVSSSLRLKNLKPLQML